MTARPSRPVAFALPLIAVAIAVTAPGCQTDSRRTQKPQGAEAPMLPALGSEVSARPTTVPPSLESAQHHLNDAAHDLNAGARQAAGDLATGAQATGDQLNALARQKAAALQQGAAQTAGRATDAAARQAKTFSNDFLNAPAAAPAAAAPTAGPAPVVELPAPGAAAGRADQ